MLTNPKQFLNQTSNQLNLNASMKAGLHLDLDALLREDTCDFEAPKTAKNPPSNKKSMKDEGSKSNRT